MSKIKKREGSLFDLLRHILSENREYVPIFVVVHPKWNTSDEVFNCIQFILSYTRVTEYPFLSHFVIEWIRQYFQPLEQHTFVYSVIMEILDLYFKEGCLEPYNRIRLALLRKKMHRHRSHSMPPKRTLSIIGAEMEKPSFAKHITEQLTLIEAEYFRNIVIEEILMLKWRKEHENEILEDTISQMVAHTNKITAWFSKLFLREADPKNQLKVLTFLAEIIEHARAIKNYHLLMELYSAIESWLVKRIIELIRLNKKIKDAFQWLQRLFSFERNYKKYRKKLEKRKRQSLPFLPYLGILTSDLYFIEEGNRDYDRHKNINIEKMELISKQLEEFKSYQQYAIFSIASDNKLIRFFDTLPHIPQEDLEALSQRLKPFPC